MPSEGSPKKRLVASAAATRARVTDHSWRPLLRTAWRGGESVAEELAESLEVDVGEPLHLEAALAGLVLSEPRHRLWRSIDTGGGVDRLLPW
jgi:hypothetical protein